VGLARWGTVFVAGVVPEGGGGGGDRANWDSLFSLSVVVGVNPTGPTGYIHTRKHRLTVALRAGAGAPCAQPLS